MKRLSIAFVLLGCSRPPILAGGGEAGGAPVETQAGAQAGEGGAPQAEAPQGGSGSESPAGDPEDAGNGMGGKGLVIHKASGGKSGQAGRGTGGTGPNVGGSPDDGGAPQVAEAGSGGDPGPAAGSGEGGMAGSGDAGDSLAEDAAFCNAELDRAALQYAGFRGAYTDPTQVPRSAKDGSVRLVPTSDWTSGFPAGSFWLLYEHTGDSTWRDVAETMTDALTSQRLRTDTHDIGFIINSSFGQGYRLTGNEAYAGVIRDAAASLSTRFNVNVGATRSWNGGGWSFPVIIDNMMNLELLFHAEELGGDEAFRSMAITHALTTQKNHFRPDASSYHVVDYDPVTGAVIKRVTNQGVSDDSDWARGQAWGLYGFTMSFRQTNDERFLAQAISIADFYTQSSAMPADGVPYFDFFTFGDDSIPDYRDASAGAIAASALLELARYAPPAAAERYLTFALKVVRSLSASPYRADLGQNSYFLLQHSVGNYPQGSEIDVAINYADYYYLEALMRCGALR